MRETYQIHENKGKKTGHFIQMDTTIFPSRRRSETQNPPMDFFFVQSGKRVRFRVPVIFRRKRWYGVKIEEFLAAMSALGFAKLITHDTKTFFWVNASFTMVN